MMVDADTAVVGEECEIDFKEDAKFAQHLKNYKLAKVVVTSELSLGSGLGSSTALFVALSAALLALYDSVKLDKVKDDQWKAIRDRQHSKHLWSGELTHIRTNVPLKMLKTNTKFGKNTKSLVAARRLLTSIQSPVSDDLAITEKEEKLEKLLEMSQGFLQCMGVSHASIENVIRTTLKYKLSTKLTGVGGGGCVLTLLPTLVDKVIADLEARGIQCLIAGTGLGTLKDQWENTLPSWGKSDDPCTAWEGVACNNSRVPSLDLSFNPGLSGSLSPRLGDLRKLTILILRVESSLWDLQEDDLDLAGNGPKFEHHAMIPARTNTGMEQSNRLVGAYQHEGGPLYDLLQILFNDLGVENEFYPTFDANELDQDYDEEVSYDMDAELDALLNATPSDSGSDR
ncbi:hypothetical protein ACS0TY_017678 [Phlomoides rotata]